MPKPRGKKDTVKEISVNGMKEEVVDDSEALLNPIINVKNLITDAQVKSTNGRGGRMKKAEKVEKEEMPAKKATASKGRGKKKEEDVEVIAKETEENAVSGNGAVEEVKVEVVIKGGKGSRGKRGEKAAILDNGEKTENGELIEVATNSRVVKGGKKSAKINKDTNEAPENVADKKPTAKTGGRKKKTDEKEAVAELNEDLEENVPEKAAVKTGGRKKKTNEKDTVAVLTDDPPNEAVSEKSVDTKVVETKAASKTGGRKKKVEENEAAAVSTDNELNDKNSTHNQKEQTKKKGRGATKKPAAKEVKATVHKYEEPTIVEQETAKKPTKRGAKETTKDKTEDEKIPTKRARATKPTSKVEEAPTVEKGQTEENAPKKRSRKETSAEMELKPDTEKSKKIRGGKKKTEKIDEENAAEPQEGKEEETDKTAEETEDSKKAEKPTTSRGRKRAAPSANKPKIVDDKVDDDKNDVDADEDEADGSKPSKTKKKKEPATLVNATTTIYNKADFDLPPVADGQNAGDEPRFNFKISSWNVAGLRSWLKKDGLKFLEYEEPDIFCLQETKCTTEQLPEEVVRIPGYHPYWLCMPGGHAGVAIYSKIMPINVEYGIGDKEFDDVGRLITAEYEKFFLINVYVPNSGRKLVNLSQRMKWEKLFKQFVQKLNDIKPVVISGDMNVSHAEIDLANPKSNARSAGFTREERDKMSELLALGYVDTFRHLYPDLKGAYTFWAYFANARSRNVGWRLDYFIVSERFIKRVVDNCIRSQCMGSDHCPITLFLKL